MKYFDLQPTLTGKFLELKPLEVSDFDQLYAAASDPLIWEQHPFADRYKKDVFQSFFEVAMQSKGAFKVIDKSKNRIIGSSRYYDLDLVKSEVAIGYTFLERDYWGKQWNREMKKLMLDHAFKFVDTVLFHVGPKNIRSQKAMAKIGGINLGIIYLNERVNPETLLFKIDKENYGL